MGEIRLICPGCGAEYRLDDGMIPAQGREVECSACARVWHQPGADAARQARPVSPVVPAPPPGQRRDPIDFVLSRNHPDRDRTMPPVRQDTAPRLSRPLPAGVLSILTEEAERERAARAADGPVVPVPPTPDWPATTVTATPSSLSSQPHETPATTAPAPETITPPADSGAQTITPPVPASSPQSAPVMDRQPPAKVIRRDRRGLVLGLLIAALALALYLAAPLVPQDTAAGQVLGQWRGLADQARHWLADLF
ncbi:MAG: zinc-ribbon domain-containing protein [Paracoccus sp. (in: a-proteobacteria)]|nr:zinc-ribbon domain-containing protein [Paracoccus sp. (in: a-proteobacteria)]